MNSRQAIAFLNLFSLSSLKTGSLSRSECNQINNVRVSTEFFDSQPQPRISRTVNLLHCDNPASSQNQCRHTEIRAPKNQNLLNLSNRLERKSLVSRSPSSLCWQYFTNIMKCIYRDSVLPLIYNTVLW